MKNKFSMALSLAVILSLLLTSLAMASDVDVAVVDVTVPNNSVTLAPGASGNITINMSVTGNQAGTATFEVNRDWTLSGGIFTGSNPQEFTVGPRAGGDPATTFSTSGTVTVAAGQAAGAFTLAVGAFDITNSNATGAKLAAGDPSNYQVTVTAPPPPSDSTPPSISYVLSPASPDGANGWYKSNVTLTWTVTENESPSSLVKTGCVDQNILADQQETTYSCAASSAGGSADQVDVSIKRDATPPSVALVGGPADGGSYYFGSVPAAPTCNASDDTSGLAGACSVSGYGDTVGSHTVTASASDNAGNSASASATYTVLAWTLSGFYNPVDMGGVLNTVKNGSTVPLKFEIFAGSTELTDPSIVNQPLKATQTLCTGGTADDIELLSSGATILRYDATAGQFIYNWQTPKGKAGYCYVVTVTTADGSSISANFKLK